MADLFNAPQGAYQGLAQSSLGQDFGSALGAVIANALTPAKTEQQKEEELWKSLDNTSRNNVRKFFKQLQATPMDKRDEYIRMNIDLYSPQERALIGLTLHKPNWSEFIGQHEPSMTESKNVISLGEQQGWLPTTGIPGPSDKEINRLQMEQMQTPTAPDLTTFKSPARTRIDKEVAKIRSLPDTALKEDTWSKDKALFTPDEQAAIENVIFPWTGFGEKTPPEIPTTTGGLAPKGGIPEPLPFEKPIGYVPPVPSTVGELVSYFGKLDKIKVKANNLTEDERAKASTYIANMLKYDTQQERMRYFLNNVPHDNELFMAYIWQTINLPINRAKYDLTAQKTPRSQVSQYLRDVAPYFEKLDNIDVSADDLTDAEIEEANSYMLDLKKYKNLEDKMKHFLDIVPQDNELLAAYVWQSVSLPLNKPKPKPEPKPATTSGGSTWWNPLSWGRAPLP